MEREFFHFPNIPHTGPAQGKANEATALGPAPSRAPHHVKKSLNIPFIFIVSPYNGCKKFNQL